MAMSIDLVVHNILSFAKPLYNTDQFEFEEIPMAGFDSLRLINKRFYKHFCESFFNSYVNHKVINSYYKVILFSRMISISKNIPKYLRQEINLSESQRKDLNLNSGTVEIDFYYERCTEAYVFSIGKEKIVAFVDAAMLGSEGVIVTKLYKIDNNFVNQNRVLLTYDSKKNIFGYHKLGKEWWKSENFRGSFQKYNKHFFITLAQHMFYVMQKSTIHVSDQIYYQAESQKKLSNHNLCAPDLSLSIIKDNESLLIHTIISLSRYEKTLKLCDTHIPHYVSALEQYDEIYKRTLKIDTAKELLFYVTVYYTIVLFSCIVLSFCCFNIFLGKKYYTLYLFFISSYCWLNKKEHIYKEKIKAFEDNLVHYPEIQKISDKGCGCFRQPLLQECVYNDSHLYISIDNTCFLLFQDIRLPKDMLYELQPRDLPELLNPSPKSWYEKMECWIWRLIMAYVPFPGFSAGAGVGGCHHVRISKRE